MLAEKILKIAKMNDYECYKELEKMGFDINNKVWKEYASIYPRGEQYNKSILIRILCENEIKEQARKTTLKPSAKKRIKAIEKFLNNNRKDCNTKARPVFHHYYDAGQEIVYTNTHMLGVITKEDAQGLNKNYDLKNYEGVFPDYKKVIPELTSDHETATINYGEVLAIYKQNKANKAEHDYYIAIFNDGTIGAYHTPYLLHCFEVLGQDEITLKRNNKTWQPPAQWRDPEDVPQNIQPAIVTAENTSSFLVVTPVRVPQEVLKQYHKQAGDQTSGGE